MRFYYISIISVFMLFVIWFVGTGLLVWLGSHLRKTGKRVWPMMLPLFLLLYLAPISEELWIAWNFGQLCRKDAGIFVYRTVEAEGYYDATAGLWKVNNPVLPVTAESFDKQGYRFFEMSVADTKGGPSKVAHFEKVNGVWIPTILDQPTARYRYQWPNHYTRVSHKIVRHERNVLDAADNDVLGRDIEYGRRAPWFFVGLDSPVMLCPTNHPLAKYGSITQQTLKPMRTQ